MKDFDVKSVDKNMDFNQGTLSGIKWISPRESPFLITGFPWINKESIYRRLPLNPKYKLTDAVNILADCTAGGQIHFKTDSSKIHIKVFLSGIANMVHMPATGQCGFDLYIGNETNLHYCSTTKYDHRNTEYECLLYDGTTKENKNVLINFPLYQGVNEVYIGIEENCNIFAPPKFVYSKDIVFYGTSITQGGCASRPGMAYTNILSRKLNANCINLGFSGSGCGEPEMAKIISEMNNIGLLVLDYEPNCLSTENYMETLPKFIEIFRKKQKQVPILVISRISYSLDIFYPETLKERVERNNFQKYLVDSLRAKGDSALFFCDGSTLLGEDFHECTVDGIHPTDLGFSRIADKLYRVIKEILDKA